MANRNFQTPEGSLTERRVVLDGTVTMGVAGAISAVSAKGFTVTAPDANSYLLTLEDTYTSLLGVDLVVQSGAPPYTSGRALLNYISASDVAGARTITIQFGRQDNVGAWTSTSLADSAVVRLVVSLDNSSL